MYQVLLGDLNSDYKTIYYPGDSECVIYDSKLNLQIGNAGTFEFKIPPENPLCQELRQGSIISVLRDGAEFWRGYVTEINKDFNKILDVYCVEDFMWMNEEYSYYPFRRDTNTNAYNFENLIQKYNESHAADGRTFNVGMITNVNGSDVAVWVNTYEMTNLSCIRENLCQDNGFLKVRRVTSNGHVERYIDCLRLSDYGIQATQNIEFGDNLLDYAEEIDGSNIVNVLYPVGAETEEEIFEGQKRRIHGTTLSSTASINSFGRRERLVIFDTDDIDLLGTLAQAYLTRYSQPQMKLSLTAIDLADLGQSDAHYNIGDRIHVVADPFGIDQWIYVTEQNINIQNPADNTITLADNVRVGSQTLTQQTIDTQELLKEIPSESSILSSARQNALRLLEGADGGHVSFGTDVNGNIDELRIANAEDIDQATKKWIWNVNGLGYMERSTPQGTWSAPEVAMTMDGSIVADAITSGSLTLGNGGNDAPLLQVYSGDTLVARINRSGLYAILGTIGGFTIGTSRLTRGDAALSENVIGCGSAGYGLVNLVGKSTDYGQGNMGYIQISNSGSPGACYDGIRIYGDGKVVRYNGNGGVSWEKWLSNIPNG